jgi:hypothetical protein
MSGSSEACLNEPHQSRAKDKNMLVKERKQRRSMPEMGLLDQRAEENNVLVKERTPCRSMPE